MNEQQKRDAQILSLALSGWDFSEAYPTVNEQYAVKAYHRKHGTVIGKSSSEGNALSYAIAKCYASEGA